MVHLYLQNIYIFFIFQPKKEGILNVEWMFDEENEKHRSSQK